MSFLKSTAAGQSILSAADAAAQKTLLSLNNVENTALSTWAGSTSITTVGTVATGTWSATAIASSKGGLGSDFSAQSGILKFATGTASVVTAPTGAIVGTSDTQTLTNKSISGATNTLSSISSGSLDLSSTFAFTGVVTVQTPTADAQAATKAYVDSIAAGLSVKTAVLAATTGALPACTYSNGSSGVGATLTGNSNGALPSQDGVSLSVTNRLLVKDQVTGLQNGAYVVTQVGDAGTPFILTRATDFDTAAKMIDGSYFFVQQGTGGVS